MNLVDIAKRCRREFINSRSAAQLAVAYRYYRLFYKKMVDRGVSQQVINVIDKQLIKTYKKYKAKLL